MRALRAFLLGLAAGAVVVYVSAATAALVLSASGAEVAVGLGGAVLVAVERTAGGTETTFGPALMAVPVLCGLANAIAAARMR